jgi:glycosyltransferase involved in cell wall biosynthesis
MRVLLNGINAFSKGGRAVVSNVATLIAEAGKDIHFDLVLPAGHGYEHVHSEGNLNVHLINCSGSRTLQRFLDIHFYIAKWCRQFQSDICFTLGDVGPARLPVPHVVLLQQAMIVYRDLAFERLWTMSERLKFRYTRRHFGKMAANCAAITVQSPVMAKRLNDTYHNIPLDNIWVIPSTVPRCLPSEKVSVMPESHMMSVNKPYRLLFLAAGYEHKNHIILPSLVLELRNRGLSDQVQIFVTLDPDVSPYEHKLLSSLSSYTDCITNLGRVGRSQVAGCYAAASALFIPTLVESFGLIYLEAMSHGCPILTSDRDFAKWICGDTACYFDPLDPISIVNTLEKFVKEGKDKEYKRIASQRLKEFPSSWKIVARQYVDMLRQIHSAQA